jgi:hypothetical protein
MRGDIRRVAESSSLFDRDLDFRRRGGVLTPTIDSAIATSRAADFALGNSREGANALTTPFNFKSSSKRRPHERNRNAGSFVVSSNPDCASLHPGFCNGR